MKGDLQGRDRQDPDLFSTVVSVSLVVVAIGGLYLHNLDGWLICDDEGTDFYEIWRISEGDIPGKDLVTEQPPLFLLAGVGLGLLSDFNVSVLRGASVVLILASAWPVFLIGREIWSPRAGLLGMVLYLLNHMVYSLARLFRPDPWMTALSVLGLCFFVFAQMREKRWYLPLSGAVYAAGTLCKLFGVLPLGGCLLFLIYQALAGRRPLRRSLEDAALVGIPFLLITVGGILAFYPPGSAFYTSVIGQHWQVGHQTGLIQRAEKGLIGLVHLLRENLVFIFVLPFLATLGLRRRPGEGILAWQMPTGLAFFVLSRPIWPRYWLYLVPLFCLILGSIADELLRWMESRWSSRAAILPILVGILLLGLGVAQSTPIILRNARLYEDRTRALAAYIADHTAPDELVLSDYAGLNFHARRPSVYQASIIATGRIKGGFVTSAGLIREIEANDVALVALHVPGGISPPTHLIHLQDFEGFYSYLNRDFCLIDTFDRAGQLFEIYQRCSERTG